MDIIDFFFVLETSFEILGDCIEEGVICFVHIFILVVLIPSWFCPCAK